MRELTSGRIVWNCVAAIALFILSACNEPDTQAPTGNMSGAESFGDAKQGANEIVQVGCGSCHTIPGIAGAAGLVGPPLDRMARRIYVAGLLRNTPDNMTDWLRNPQRIVPGNAMPDMKLSEEQARNIAAYLYTLR